MNACCTGEMPISIEDLDAMDDDALGLIALTLPDSAKKLLALTGKAEMLIRQRMEERGATKLDTEHVSGTLASSGYTHTIDDPQALADALWDAPGVDHLALDDMYRAPEPVKRWDQRGLNELLKRGGAIREAIERYRTSTPNPPKLELKAKKGA